jgi:hypothetical protein
MEIVFFHNFALPPALRAHRNSHAVRIHGVRCPSDIIEANMSMFPAGRNCPSRPM